MENEKILKIKNITIASFFIVFAIVLVYLAFGPIKRISDSYSPSRIVSVSSDGKAVVSPDIAKFSFSVVTDGKDPEKIAQDNNDKINKAISFVKSQGIDGKDIKTTQYNLSPRYEYDEKNRRTFISGYELTQTVLVKIRDFTKIGKVLGELPGIGVNQIGSISFEVENPDKFLAEARNQAFDKARQKALEMANKNGVKLGRVINFSEYQGQVPIPYAAESFGKGMGAPMATVPNIEPGTQEMTVQVNVSYEIK